MKYYSRETAEITKKMETDEAEGEPIRAPFGVTWTCPGTPREEACRRL